MAIGLRTVALMFVDHQRATCSMQHSGAWNFDMTHTFLENLCTPALVYLVHLFNDVISISDYTESKERAISKQCFGTAVEGSVLCHCEVLS